MTILSGRAVLIVDGRNFEGCSVALESENGSSRSFGFLSTPSEVLQQARAAEWVEIRFPGHMPVEITLLAINSVTALFTFAETKRIRVTLTSKRWVAVVEGSDVRDVCIHAEKQLRESRPVPGAVAYHVLGADGQEATAITDYLNNVQLSMIDPHPRQT